MEGRPRHQLRLQDLVGNGYEQIESVAKGADEREVVVTFKQPYADWKGLFSPLYPASTNNDPEVFNDGLDRQDPGHRRPVQVRGLDQTAKTLTIARDDKWWGDQAKLDRIIYRAIPADAQIDALINGEIDFIDIGPDVNKLQRATEAPGINSTRRVARSSATSPSTARAPILKDAKVRQALAMAIDRRPIAKTLLGPLGVDCQAARRTTSSWPTRRATRTTPASCPSPDVEGAKKLLDEAGWTVEGDVRKKDGKELAIRFVIPTRWRRRSRSPSWSSTC